ncbi:MAG: hypothetical protein R6U51_09075 [Anaerolineales bacterium]
MNVAKAGWFVLISLHALYMGMWGGLSSYPTTTPFLKYTRSPLGKVLVEFPSRHLEGQRGSLIPNQRPIPLSESTPEPTREEWLGNVMVTVVDQREDENLAPDLRVKLEGYDHMTQVYVQSLPLKEDGKITFPSVPLKPGLHYFASLVYQGATYRSDVVQLKSDNKTLDLQIQVYGTTTDQGSLSVESLHIFVNFSDQALVKFGEMFIVSNFGPKTVVSEKKGEPVLDFPLPEGAQNIKFESGSLGERYVFTENGFGDTMSVPPGSGVYQTTVFFDIPYKDNHLEFTQKTNLPVGSVEIMTPAQGVDVQGTFLQDMGIREVQGGGIHVYLAENVRRGEQIRFALSGLPGQSDPGKELVLVEDQKSFLIGFSVLSGALLLIGMWFYHQRLENEGPDPDLNQVSKDKAELTDAIIALDNLYAEGEIQENVYRSRRETLKARLRESVEKEMQDD